MATEYFRVTGAYVLFFVFYVMNLSVTPRCMSQHGVGLCGDKHCSVFRLRAISYSAESENDIFLNWLTVFVVLRAEPEYLVRNKWDLTC